MPAGARAFFVSDLHGRLERYQRLLAAVEAERPGVVFLGGDLLPPESGRFAGPGAFLLGWLGPRLRALRERLARAYPRWPAILGNDDPRSEEAALQELAAEGLLEPVHGRRVELDDVCVYGYAFVPPTPFPLKDWERYDVSRFLDPGCVSPEEGTRSVAVDEDELRWGTIAADLERLAGSADLSRAVFLFHAPPHGTALDRAALDGRSVDHAPLDPHVGSIAIRRFVESRQPLLTLHGHVHESARLTGSWKQRLGRTLCLSAAHDGAELALVCFELERPQAATRRLI
jgi:Icc-related predicted phosphoesterase